jgi:hypothetical protein
LRTRQNQELQAKAYAEEFVIRNNCINFVDLLFTSKA